MNVTRFAAAPASPAPADHHGISCLRLQGLDAAPSTSLWVGVSRIEPGEARAVENRSGSPADLLVAMPLPAPT